MGSLGFVSFVMCGLCFGCLYNNNNSTHDHFKHTTKTNDVPYEYWAMVWCPRMKMRTAHENRSLSRSVDGQSPLSNTCGSFQSKTLHVLAQVGQASLKHDRDSFRCRHTPSFLSRCRICNTSLPPCELLG
jgi:hypothetical protein